jgi:hypothetical protein
MNDAPILPPQSPPQPIQPDQNDQAVQPGPVIQPQGSQNLSMWSLVLGITSLVLGIIVLISIPAAIAAVILGILVLVKHQPGRGKAVAGISTGGVFLLIALPLIAFTVLAYNSAPQKASDTNRAATQQAADKRTATATNGSNVDTSCYSYLVPSGYEYDTTSKDCSTAVNTPKGDSLTRITVKGNTGTIGSLQDVVTAFNKTLQNGNSSAPGVIDQSTTIINGHTVYYISYKDSNGLLFGNYIFPDTSASQKDTAGKTITAYTVAGYTYNLNLKNIVRGVVESLTIK